MIVRVMAGIIIAAALSRAERVASAENSTDDGHPRPANCLWLRIGRDYFIDPDRALVLRLTNRADKQGNLTAIRVHLLDLNRKTGKFLLELPQSVLAHDHTWAVPSNMALTPNQELLLVDRETWDGTALNGREVEWSTPQQKSQISYLRRAIFAVPVNSGSYVGEPVDLTQSGDCDNWCFDALNDRIVSTLRENGNIGMAIYTLQGKRVQTLGIRKLPPSGISFNGRAGSTPPEQDVTVLKNGSCVVIAPDSRALLRYPINAVAPAAFATIQGSNEAAKPTDIPINRAGHQFTICALAATADGAGVIAGFTVMSEKPGVCQETDNEIWLLDRMDGGTWRKVCDGPRFANVDGRVLTASADGSSIWMLTYRSVGGMSSEDNHYVGKVDIATRKYQNVWTMKDIKGIRPAEK